MAMHPSPKCPMPVAETAIDAAIRTILLAPAATAKAFGDGPRRWPEGGYW